MRFLCNVLFILTLCDFSLAAQEAPHTYTVEEAKAHYVIETFKHVTWPNQNSIDYFTLGIITKDKKLIVALTQIESRIIKNKDIFVRTLDIENTKNKYYSAIFIDKKNTHLTSRIKTKFPEALIITDGKVDDDELMIALVTHKKTIRIELNRDNLRQRNFSVSNTLLNFGGTKEELNQQLIEKESYLRELIFDEKLRENKLSELNDKLLEVQKKLDFLEKERDSSVIEKNNNKNSIDQQKRLIAEKQIELQALQKNLLKLNQEIQENELHQKQQLIELQQQNTVIEKKEKTISIQRLFVYMATGITCIVLLLIYFIMRLNRISKKDNKELAALNEQLYELATTDSMTKLFNRVHFLESAQTQVAQLQRNRSEGAILMIDIDFFKNINDTFGHAAGDKAIISVADVFRENLREYDIVGRLGGEEYGMLLANCPIKKATEIAERLREKIAALLIIFNDNAISLTVSIGLAAIYPTDDNIHSASQRADKALYEAKNSGRNKVVCTHGATDESL